MDALATEDLQWPSHDQLPLEGAGSQTFSDAYSFARNGPLHRSLPSSFTAQYTPPICDFTSASSGLTDTRSQQFQEHNDGGDAKVGDSHLQNEYERLNPWNLGATDFVGHATHVAVPLDQNFARFANKQRGRHPEPINPALPRERSRYSRPGGRETAAIPIPHAKNSTSADPMQRWHESPPEDEPVPLSALYDALRNTSSSLPDPGSTAARMGRPTSRSTKRVSARHYRRATSVTSHESAASTESGYSADSAHSFSSAASQTLRAPARKISRRQQTQRQPRSLDETRPFKCTFCCDDFKHRYDWVRHEKSRHLDLEEWKCTPQGSTIFSPLTGRAHCAFCYVLDPTVEHLEMHNYDACHDATGQTRTFKRKDHLVQHLRLVHAVATMPLIENWKLEASPVTSRCGFCDSKLTSWDERADHLSEHFRKGLTMTSWHGEHNFDPEIAARVRHAMPPYLIGAESQCLVPFSATKRGTKDHFAQISSQINQAMDPSTGEAGDVQQHGVFPPSGTEPGFSQSPVNTKVYIDLLMQHLSRYAHEQAKLGIIVTNEMFQQESRRVLYSCEDSWNQTIADNTEWLVAFRRQYGLLNISNEN